MLRSIQAMLPSSLHPQLFSKDLVIPLKHPVKMLLARPWLHSLSRDMLKSRARLKDEQVNCVN